MPIYTYEHPETNEQIDIVQSMDEEHVYVDDEGIKWNRIFIAPNAAIDTQIDCDDSNRFVEKTGKSKGTVGDMWDRSKELSEKRKQRHGKDPIKEKFLKDKYKDGKCPLPKDE